MHAACRPLPSSHPPPHPTFTPTPTPPPPPPHPHPHPHPHPTSPHPRQRSDHDPNVWYAYEDECGNPGKRVECAVHRLVTFTLTLTLTSTSPPPSLPPHPDTLLLTLTRWRAPRSLAFTLTSPSPSPHPHTLTLTSESACTPRNPDGTIWRPRVLLHGALTNAARVASTDLGCCSTGPTNAARGLHRPRSAVQRPHQVRLGVASTDRRACLQHSLQGHSSTGVAALS